VVTSDGPDGQMRQQFKEDEVAAVAMALRAIRDAAPRCTRFSQTIYELTQWLHLALGQRLPTSQFCELSQDGRAYDIAYIVYSIADSQPDGMGIFHHARDVSPGIAGS